MKGNAQGRGGVEEIPFSLTHGGDKGSSAPSNSTPGASQPPACLLLFSSQLGPGASWQTMPCCSLEQVRRYIKKSPQIGVPRPKSAYDPREPHEGTGVHGCPACGNSQQFAAGYLILTLWRCRFERPATSRSRPCPPPGAPTAFCAPEICECLFRFIVQPNPQISAEACVD